MESFWDAEKSFIAEIEASLLIEKAPEKKSERRLRGEGGGETFFGHL